MFVKYMMCSMALLIGISAFAENPPSVIREEHKVIVDGVEELWRLEWTGPTISVCSPDEPDVWFTCPCNGFAFGEEGNLVLIRKKPGKEDERLELAPLFTGEFWTTGKEGQAILRRWDVDEKDMDASKSPDFAARVRARPLAQVMHFGDYDHDGQDTEFILQIGTLPCGKRMSVAVGVSRHNPRLHVLSSAEHPERPLVLQAEQWEALLQAKRPVKVMDWKCWDHGSEEETELELSADDSGIHATTSTYECDEDGRRAKLIGKEVL